MNDKTDTTHGGLENESQSKHHSNQVPAAPGHSPTTTEPSPATTSYTPGPYGIEYDRDGCDEYFQIVDMKGSVLASILFWGEVASDQRQAFANALLFAAAPELLGALQELLSVVGGLQGADLPIELYVAEARAHAILAKAVRRE